MRNHFYLNVKFVVAAIFFELLSLGGNHIYAQQGIGTTNPNASAILDVVSTSKGVLVPRMTNAQMIAISSPAAGLQVYNTTAGCLFYYNGSSWVSEKKFISGYVTRGNALTLGQLSILVPSSGNASAQISFSTTTRSITGVSINSYGSTTAGSAVYGTISNYMVQSQAFGSTYKYWESGLNLSNPGNSQQIWFTDETMWKFYKITITTGASGSNKDQIEIEEMDK